MLEEILRAAQSPDPDVRNQAEAKLAEADQVSGFGTTLVHFTISQDVSPELRQMAALLLKKFVRTHWTPETEHFQAPLVREEEKVSIRRELPHGLADQNSKIRTAVAMAIATIAKWDVPESWPTLPQDLVGAIASKENRALVSGSVRCLSMFVDDLDEALVVQVAPKLLPELLNIASQPEAYELSVQKRAVATMSGLVMLCANALGPHKKEARRVLLPHLGPWLQQLCMLLTLPQTPQSSSEAGAMKMEVLKALVNIFSNYGKQVQPAAPEVLQRCWDLLVQCLPLYERSLVNSSSSASEDAEVDSEGDTIDFSSVISQLFEFLLTLANSSRFQPLLENGLQQLIYLSIGYMQITREQEETWSRDVNQFLADQDENVFGVRNSVGALLDQLFECLPAKAAAALSAAVQDRFQEAMNLKREGTSTWWKLREAALMAVSNVAEELMAPVPQQHFQVFALLDNVLQEDLQAGIPDYLQSTALSSMSKLAEAVDAQRALPILQASASGLAANRSPVAQIGACHAVLQLSMKLDTVVLRPLLSPIYMGLGALLRAHQEEALELILETLAAVIRADPETAASLQPQITPALLLIWANNALDPLLSGLSMSVIGTLAKIPAALPDLQARVVPVLVSIASKPDINSASLVEAALDLATVVLKPSTPEGAAAVHSMCSATVMGLLRQHTDAGVLQSCCEYLRILISVGGEAVFTYGGTDPDATVREILSAAKRLLDPDIGDSAPLYVGQVMSALLRTGQERAVKAMVDILPAAMAKLAAAKSSPLIVDLLSVFAQLVHINAVQLIELLAAAPSPGGQGSALDLLLQVWTERALEFNGMKNRLSTSALATLLATRHSALANVQVKGKRLDVNSGIRTRSRAAKQKEEWLWVPAQAKLFLLLADILVEAKEGRAEEDDDEWEAVSDSDGESVALSSHAGDALKGTQGADSVPSSIIRAAMEEGYNSDDEVEQVEDPLNNLDLADFVKGQMRLLAQQDRSLFDKCCGMLNQPQFRAVEECF